MIRSSYSSPTGSRPSYNGARALHLAGKPMRPRSQPAKAHDRPRTHTVFARNHPRFSPHPVPLRTGQMGNTQPVATTRKKTL